MAQREPEFRHDVETAMVTGAVGDVGSWVVDRLADQGVAVVGVDVERPEGTRMNAEFRAVDLRDQAETWETVHETDPDMIVHLAAISNPLDTPGTRVFDNNVSSTYNVLVAAGRADVDVVWTSSQAVYGALFAAEPWLPDYLPIDEQHDLRPADPYGTSKRCGEQVAEMVVRRYGIAVTTVRPVTVLTPEMHRARPPRDSSDLTVDETSGGFGSYVDVRDVARLIEASLGASHEGHELVLCAADENYLGQPTAELVEAICGELPEECDLQGKQAAFSNAKAERVLGWTPAYSAPEHNLDDVSAPNWL